VKWKDCKTGEKVMKTKKKKEKKHEENEYSMQKKQEGKFPWKKVKHAEKKRKKRIIFPLRTRG